MEQLLRDLWCLDAPLEPGKGLLEKSWSLHDTVSCTVHGSSTPEGSQNHSLEKTVSSCLLQLPEAEVGPTRRCRIFGYREPGQKWGHLHCSCLGWRKEEPSIWEDCGVKITPLALGGSFSNAPRDTKTLSGVELKVGLKSNAAFRRERSAVRKEGN